MGNYFPTLKKRYRVARASSFFGKEVRVRRLELGSHLATSWRMKITEEGIVERITEKWAQSSLCTMPRAIQKLQLE